MEDQVELLTLAYNSPFVGEMHQHPAVVSGQRDRSLIVKGSGDLQILGEVPLGDER